MDSSPLAYQRDQMFENQLIIESNINFELKHSKVQNLQVKQMDINLESQSEFSTKATKSFSLPHNFLNRFATKVLEENIVKTVYKKTLQGLLDAKTNNDLVEQINLDKIFNFFEEQNKQRAIKKKRVTNKNYRKGLPH